MDTNSLILTLLNLKGWGPKKIYSYVLANLFDYEKCVLGLNSILSEEEKILFKSELMNSKKTLNLNYNLGIKTCNILDKEFPSKLYKGTDICVFLYYVGDISLLSKKSISIIGTRKPTEEYVVKGIKATKYLSEKGYVVVSGLALGCDSIAHEACIEAKGKTIAVLPSACDNIQPSSNRKLAEKILQSGGLLLSEYSAGSTISKFNYPRRDRIQSLLSSTILIIQASDSSGTMIATKKSIKDGKLVYAISGNNLSLVSRYVDVDSEDELKELSNWILEV